MPKEITRVKSAERGAKISISIYIVLALFKVFLGNEFRSSSLLADGFNNVTDVISSATVLIGLKTARMPADHNHPYGHWKAEPIASLITSFIMLLVGLQVLESSIARIITGEITPPNQLAAVVSFASSLILFSLYRYNLSLAKRVNSAGLKAVSNNNLADSLTSFGATVAIIGAASGWIWLDRVMAVIVSLIIIKTGVDVFKESIFSLSDGFKDKHLAEYKEELLKLSQVKEVASIKARMYGANTYVDVTILVDGSLTVQEGHDVTEKIEKMLYEKFDVMHTDVHVEPDSIESQFNKEQM